MASRAAALLLLALVCIEFAAGKQEGGFQFPGCIGGSCVCTSSPLALTHPAFVLLQLKLCWTAVRPKPPNSSHFRESKATGFRILGPAVTSTLLCEAQTSKKPPSINRRSLGWTLLCILWSNCVSLLHHQLCGKEWTPPVCLPSQWREVGEETHWCSGEEETETCWGSGTQPAWVALFLSERWGELLQISL